MDGVFDLAIIGGGINGCACAADASLRGLSVVLLEKDDLASHTSSSSTKLIHGGLRYLEYYEFKLVKKALEERQRLLDLAPHLVQPQPFVLPYQTHMRPAWFLRLGLFLYDYLSRQNRLPKSISINRNTNESYFTPLKNTFKKGFRFYDASTDDARLTLANALTAKNNGAHIKTRSTVIHLEVVDNLWQLTIQPKSGSQYILRAKVLINAAGPWVESVAGMARIPSKKITLVKGSHLLVPELYQGKQAYFLQHKDKRAVFVIPYHGYSMIGTTEVLFNDSVDQVQISNEEIDYLISFVNTCFNKKLSKEAVLFSWSGVRTLVANNDQKMSSITRDYSFGYTSLPAPAVTIYSGKLTTCRQLAEEVINQLVPIFPNINPCTTRKNPLPGATLGTMSFEDYIIFAKNKYQWLDSGLLNRYLYTYGTCMEAFLSQCSSLNDLGKKFGTSLYQAEVDYLIAEEWAQECDDILKRRTKLFLEMDSVGQQELMEYLLQKQISDEIL